MWIRDVSCWERYATGDKELAVQHVDNRGGAYQCRAAHDLLVPRFLLLLPVLLRELTGRLIYLQAVARDPGSRILRRDEVLG